MRSRLVTVVTVLALLSGYGAATCLGWQASASARAACCKAADHVCDQADADDCCAQGEQRRNGSPSIAIALPVTPSMTEFTVLVPPHVPSRPTRSRELAPPAPHVSPHVLLSVFLV
jgi:hypothetical protein